ncbi:NAD(P)/FAD-dependent oxidoreductase [Mycobacterium sp. CVI_P3]|uniref:NAD(P)/FAD-dependent oxidoreductase n=1 Tax=Mycobacterium pinniadriaticum TaxID=2994102 RepID=A0ABT3SKT8_9MYCO|nr:NAD(P)/FAD-dependent oxidoreductase [Mycobacterium pinniadriaticum]MCX2933717.1 NAD(P)/FAD-dependent oxidoreductase [Mycobacterium pinniadriaticum]MCX2940139.1 NAD(P)/FAD-dependent oxidoreductase [Mycobacterium pinniadriaticum]
MTVVEPSVAETATEPVHTRALVIGTGFSGLGMGIELQARGVDFLILEKADDVGGTWRDNSYPGCACDIPAHLYSFSFEPKPDWTYMWSEQPEILDYLKGVTDKHGLRRYIRFGAHVDRAHWDDAEYRWHVFTKDGREYVAQFLISGAGALHIPAVPDVEGLADFEGAAFHSAQWDHSVDLAGKRVAVIGTGASAIQIVPEIVEEVGELQLYQRTPAWVLPRTNNPTPVWMRDAFATVPGTRALLRTGIYWFQEALGFAMTQRPELLTLGELAGKWNIRRQVRDRDLRRRLTPKYRLGCKRVLFSDGYFRAIAEPRSELVTDPIARITPHGIVTADGTEREVDVIVFATGFHVTDSYTYVGIKGPGGEDLVDRWNREGVQAHRGIAVADMPNLFFLLGPNTGLGHNSVVFMIESQIRYVGQAIDAVDKAGAQALAPSRCAQDTFNAELQQRLEGAVWSTGGCSSWYLDEHGKNRTLWSGMTWQYWLTTRSLKRSEYRFSGVGSGAPVRPSTTSAAG